MLCIINIMHYKIKKIEIRSENAAKPVSDAAAYLVNWLNNRKNTLSALDYGCGKLRYTRHLMHRSTRIGIVDSEVQLTRKQLINGEYTSVELYAKEKWPSCKIYKLEEFWTEIPHRYNFILCANVLSTIPCQKVREKSLRAIHAALTKNGQVLFANQHANSYFTQVRRKPTTRLHLDGWIAYSKNGAAYYGILTKKFLSELIPKYGFSVKNAWINGQSNYVLAERRR